MSIVLDGTNGITTPSIASSGDLTVVDKIVHDGDTNTAIRFPAADTLTVETAGLERMRVDSGGRLLLPYQPAFSATGNVGNVTISNPTALPLASTHFNRGNHYNTATSKFTAPVAGVYLMSITAFFNSDIATLVFLVNDAQIGGSDTDNLLNKNSASPNTLSMAICVNLSANDTVSLSARSGQGNTTVYVGHTTFSGYLIG